MFLDSFENLIGCTAHGVFVLMHNEVQDRLVTMPMVVRCLPHRSGFEMRRRESSAAVGEDKWSQGQTRQLEV